MLKIIRNIRLKKLIAIQAALIFAVILISALMPRETVVLTADRFELYSGVKTENAAYIDESSDYEGYFVTAPLLNLKRGSYTVEVIGVSGASGNTLVIDGDSKGIGALYDSRSNLPLGVNECSADIWLLNSEMNVWLSCEYGGSGALEISEIRITENNGLINTIALFAALAFAAFDLTVWAVARGSGVVFAVLAATVVMASLPLLYKGLLNGTDIQFHLMRLAGLKEGFAAGVVPLRLNFIAANGYGYADTLFYPNLLLWPFAFLASCSIPLGLMFEFMIFSINAATAAASYIGFKAIFKERFPALVGAVCYTLAHNRFSDCYTSAAIGEAFAIIFLPLVAAAIYVMLFEPVESEGFRRGVLLGVVGFSGIIQSHIITTTTTGIAVLVICLVFIKRTLSAGRLSALLKTAGITVALNLWSLVPFADMMTKGPYSMSPSVLMKSIASKGLDLRCLFRVDGLWLYDDYYSFNGYAIGALMFFGVLSLLFFIGSQGRGDDHRTLRIGLACLAFAVISAWAVTRYFPWDAIAEHGGIAAYIAQNIQHPRRLLMFVSLFCSICAAAGASAVKTKPRKAVFCALLVAVALFQVAHNCDRLNRSASELNKIYDTYGRSKYFTEGVTLALFSLGSREYIPADCDYFLRDMQEYGPHLLDGVEVEEFERSQGSVRMEVRNSSERTQPIDVSLMAYDGFEARDVATGEIFTTTSYKGVLCVEIPAGYSGEVTVRYVTKPLWRVCAAVSLLTLGGVLYWRYKKKEKPQAA